MRPLIWTLSPRWQMDRHGHVYVPTTDRYHRSDNGVNGDASGSRESARSDETPRNAAQSELKKDVAPRPPRASRKSRRD